MKLHGHSGQTLQALKKKNNLQSLKLQREVKLIANRWAWELVPYRLAGGLRTSGTARRYPWQPCEREPPLHATATWHRHTEKSSVEKILTLPYTYQNPWIKRAGGLGARIRNDSQKIKLQITWQQPEIRQDQLRMRMIRKDQLGMQMILKDQLKCDMKTSASPEVCCKLLGATLQVTYANRGDGWLHWLDSNFA